MLQRGRRRRATSSQTYCNITATLSYKQSQSSEPSSSSRGRVPTKASASVTSSRAAAATRPPGGHLRAFLLVPALLPVLDLTFARALHSEEASRQREAAASEALAGNVAACPASHTYHPPAPPQPFPTAPGPRTHILLRPAMAAALKRCRRQAAAIASRHARMFCLGSARARPYRRQPSAADVALPALRMSRCQRCGESVMCASMWGRTAEHMLRSLRSWVSQLGGSTCLQRWYAAPASSSMAAACAGVTTGLESAEAAMAAQ